MSTKVTLTRPIGGRKEGETIEVTAGVADYLTERGVAEKPKRASKSAD